MIKKVYEKSFSYFIVQEREKLRNRYGDNWDKFVTENYLKNIILSILKIDDLIMSKEEKYRWRNKMYNEYGKFKIVRIFFDAPLASEGHRINKKIDYFN